MFSQFPFLMNPLPAPITAPKIVAGAPTYNPTAHPIVHPTGPVGIAAPTAAPQSTLGSAPANPPLIAQTIRSAISLSTVSDCTWLPEFNAFNLVDALLAMSEKLVIGSAGGCGTNLESVMATLEKIKICSLLSCGFLHFVRDAKIDIIKLAGRRPVMKRTHCSALLEQKQDLYV